MRELEDVTDLGALQDHWNTLLVSTNNAVFSTWEWITCWWKHFGDGRRLRVLVAEEGHRPIAIAPLMLSEYKVMKFGRLRKIEFVGTPQSDYNNFILNENEPECLRLFVNHIEGLHDWDLFEVRDVLDDSTSARLLCDYSVTSPWRLEKRVSTLAPYVELPPTLEEFRRLLGEAMRHNLSRRWRRLREQYHIDFKTYRDFTSVQEAMDVLFELHQKRRSNIGGVPSPFMTSDTRAFHSELATIFAGKDWLNLNFLMADDEAIAGTYCFDYSGKTYSYQAGFDPRFSRYGVGSLLILRNIEESIRGHLGEYDFLKGAEPYKFSWPVKVRRSLVVGFVRRGLSAKAKWVVERKRRAAGRILGMADDPSQYSGFPEV